MNIHDASAVYKAAKTMADKATALGHIIKYHYKRNAHYQVKPAQYASHWLHANGDKYDKEAVEHLTGIFGKPAHPKIGTGFNKWGSRGWKK